MQCTKREQLDAYELLGINGQAAELLDKASGNPARRHEWRVGQTKVAVESHGDRQGEGYAALLADLIGIGGVAGLTGDSTNRHPAFAELGKGRKHASDGDAWMAAAKALIKREAHRLALIMVGGIAYLHIEPEEYVSDPETLELAEEYVSDPVTLELAECYLDEWLVPLLFKCLLAVTRKPSIWRPRGAAYTLLDGDIPVSGTAAEWSAALNNALARCESNNNGMGGGTYYRPLPLTPMTGTGVVGDED